MTNRHGAVLVLCTFLASPAMAQPAQVLPGREAGLALEVLQPRFQSDGAPLNSIAAFISGRYPLPAQVDFVIELPFSRSESGFGDGSESEVALGNPYMGLEVGAREAATYAELGARLPSLAQDENSGIVTGILSDIDRPEAFLPNAVAVSGGVNYLYEPEAIGFGVRLRAGPDVWVPIEDEFDDSDALERVAISVDSLHRTPCRGRHRAIGGQQGRLLRQCPGGVGDRSF